MSETDPRHDDTSVPTNDARRLTPFAGDAYPVRIGRHNARLIDWSASGVGLQLKQPTDDYAPGQPVELGIVNEHILAVMVFTGRIEWVQPDSRLVGVEFPANSEEIIRLLVNLVDRTARER